MHAVQQLPNCAGEDLNACLAAGRTFASTESLADRLDAEGRKFASLPELTALSDKQQILQYLTGPSKLFAGTKPADGFGVGAQTLSQLQEFDKAEIQFKNSDDLTTAVAFVASRNELRQYLANPSVALFADCHS